MVWEYFVDNCLDYFHIMFLGQTSFKFTQNKTQLRKIFRSIRTNSILKEGPLHYSSLKQNLSTLLSQLKIDEEKVIGSYIYVPDKEIIPPHLSNYKHAFPYFQPKNNPNSVPNMQFKLHHTNDQYTQRVYGIKIPNKMKQTIIPDVVLVPLICFNSISKQRIGYGGGYYDQFIKKCRSQQLTTLFIGIAYQSLKTDLVFWENNDQCLDFVTTQRHIY